MATESMSTCACTRSPSKRKWITRLCPSAPPRMRMTPAPHVRCAPCGRDGPTIRFRRPQAGTEEV